MINKIKIDHLPRVSGVYLFLDEKGRVLYVGKAKSIQSRVKSYFASYLDRGPKIEEMVKISKRVKYHQTDSEIEAIFLEAELINKLKPKYNTRQKDDKSFALIKISGDEYPTITLTRSREALQSDKGIAFRHSGQALTLEIARYFGPYASGLAIKKSLQYLRKIFPFRDCSATKYRIHQKKARPCLYGDIHICSAPCVNNISKTEYGKNISYFIKFLRGGKKQIIAKLNSEMKKLSKNREYEKAGEIRDKISALVEINSVAINLKDDYFEGLKILFKRIECFDISNIFGEYAVGAMSVLVDGKISTADYRKFKIKTVSGANDILMMGEIVARRFDNDWALPDLVVIDGGVGQLNIVKKILKEKNIDIPIVSIAKGVKRDKNQFLYSTSDIEKYIAMTPNIQKHLILARDEAHRFAISYYRSLHKKGMFSPLT